MIYTLTLNPALDYIVKVENFSLGKLNRITDEALFCGGKGINVSQILNQLQQPSICLGFIAGETGQLFLNNLNKIGLKNDFVEVDEGMTRINIKLKTNEETEINGQGPIINEYEFTKLLDKIKELNNNDFLVISGSVPKSLGKDVYQIIAKNTKANLIVDAEKELLLNTLMYNPFLIKPNKEEIRQIFGKKITTKEQLIECGYRLQEKGAQNVLLSLGQDGAILIDKDKVVRIMKAAKGQAINTVGCGDSMIAGFLVGYIQTHDYEFALKLASAAAGASAFNISLANKEQIDEVMSQFI